MTNVFTPAAIEAGDVVIRILTPDLKGINYLKAHQPLLVDERFRFSEHMTFAGLARPFHALDEICLLYTSPRSLNSRNIDSGRFLWVSEVMVFRRLPPDI